MVQYLPRSRRMPAAPYISIVPIPTDVSPSPEIASDRVERRREASVRLLTVERTGEVMEQ
jgi:hypothetical protein